MSEAVLTGRRVAFYFVAFFGVVAAMDAFMVTSAIRTHSGLITSEPYEKGLAYNEVVKASNVQEKLGWQGSITLESGLLRFVLMDAQKKPLHSPRATAYLSRPTSTASDMVLALHDQQAVLDLPEKGVWDIRIEAMVGDQPYQLHRRVVVP
ncbi:MAG: FixH family protein [Alphaproteobacteria bacterium]|nr:FixH family protein [Alphaproteobacteria bacterium]